MLIKTVNQTLGVFENPGLNHLFVLIFFVTTIGVGNLVNAQQRFHGKVQDAFSGAPLMGATLYLSNQHFAAGSISDEVGRFSFDNVPIGQYSLKVNYLGYEPKELIEVVIRGGIVPETQILMIPQSFVMKEVVVNGGTKNGVQSQVALVSAIGFSVEETERFAGSRADPARMVSNYAGVLGGGDMRNDIVVRGNSPNAILWSLEGLEIPSPNHFSFVGTSGGLFSVLNSNMLASSDFLTSAFPAEFGNRIGGVFDLRMRNGNVDRRRHWAQIGLNGLEMGTEGGLLKNKNASYVMSYRLFSLKPAKAIGLDFKTSGIPLFQDLSFKLHVPSKRFGTFSLFGLGGKSELSILTSEQKSEDWDPTENDDLVFGSQTYILGLTHVKSIKKNLFGKLSMLWAGSGVNANRTFVFLDKPPVLKEDLRVFESYLTTKYELNYRKSNKSFVKLGLIYQPRYYDLYQQEMEKDSSYRTHFNENGRAHNLHGFANYFFNASARLKLNIGLFAQAFSLNHRYSVEPRIGLSYALGSRNSLSLGYGLHSQQQPLIFYMRKFVDSNGDVKQPNIGLDFSRSHHLVAGYTVRMKEVWLLKMETYYQYLFSIPVTANLPFFSGVTQGGEFSFEIPEGLQSDGTGNNHGIEFTLERAYRNGYYFLFTASLFESTYIGGNGRKYYSPFSVGFITNILFGYEWFFDSDKKKSLRIDIKSNVSGGRRYIPIDLAASKLAGEQMMDFNRAYEEQFRNFYKTDLKLNYRKNLGTVSHVFFLAIDNLFNNKNPLFVEYDKNKQRIREINQLGIFPYFGYSIFF
jgi:hypothetical protein